VEVSELKNYGKSLTGKASAKVMMALFTAVPSELGIIGTPKFIAKLQRKEKYWRDYPFKTIEEKGIKNEEIIGGIRYSVAFYTSLVDSVGREKTLKAYPKLGEKMGFMMNEEFFPSAKDFRKCPDPFEALRLYLLELFRVWESEGVCQYEVLANTDTEFHAHLSYCAFDAMHHEAGCREAMEMASRGDAKFLPRLAKGLGCEFLRENQLCAGDPVCDWHFRRSSIRDL
jgi:hypothetical protein